MATLRKRNDKWHVQIRRKDYPSQTKSFISKKTAEKFYIAAKELGYNEDQIWKLPIGGTKSLL